MHTKLKIIHLEDVSTDAALVSVNLKKAGLDFETVVVDSRKEFEAALEMFTPDLILCDHSLPSFNSFEALELVKQAKLNVPFILVTATITEEFAVDILKKGATDYILKDRPERLPIAITNALEKFKLKKERKDFIRHLTKSEHKFRSLIENGLEVVVIFDAGFKPVYVSPSIGKVLGYSEVETMGLNLVDLLHPDDKELVVQKLAKCLAIPGVPIKGQEGRIRHKDGSWRWMESTLTNMLHDPVINGIVDNFRDITERKVAELALRANEEKYRSFFENSIDGILLTYPDGRILAANEAACRIFNMSETEICLAGRKGLVDLTDKRSELILNERKRTGRAKGVITLLRKDGSRFPAEISTAIYLDRSGVEKATIIFRDITERELAEIALKNSEEKYKNLFQVGPIPSWIYDVETLKILDVNQSAINHYGYSKEEFLNLTILDFRPKHEIGVIFQTKPELELTDGIIHFGTFNHLTKGNRLLKVQVSGYELEFNQRNCVMVVCNDITEKENTLQKLQRKEAKLLTAQKIARLGYWELNLVNNTIYWTNEVYNIWGRKKKDFKINLTKLLETIHPDDRAYFKELHDDSTLGLKSLDIEYRILLPDGSIKWVHDPGNLVYDGNGEPVTFEGTVQDITEWKINLEKLERSEARNRSLVQSQTNYVIRTDMAGNYTYCNNKFLEDYGWLYSEQNFIGINSISSIKEYHHDRVFNTVQKCLENQNTVHQVELDKPKRDGGIRTTLWDFICIADLDGNPSEMQCIGLDISDRIVAEDALKESIERYEYVSKATSDAIWEWDLKTDALYWGGSLKTFLGYNLNDIFPDVLSWTENLHLNDINRVIEEVDTVINNQGTNWESEYRFRKANGDYAYVVDKGFVIRNENGAAVRMVGAMRDVSENKKLEKLLSKATELARIGTFEADLVNNRLYWSDMTKEIHEVDADFVPDLDTAINFYKPGKNREVISQAVNLAMKRNIPFDEELVIVTAKGNERWVRAIGDTECKNNVCIKFFGSFQDIDKAKRAEIAVKEAYHEKFTILESIGDAFFTMDKNWVVTYWNSKAEKLLNCPQEKIIGKNLWDIFPEAIDSPFEENYKKAITESTIQHFEAYHTISEKWFEVNAYPSEAGLSVYFQDITDRKKADFRLLELHENLQLYTHELVKTNKEMEQFSYIVSHNLRAPVANIIGLADLMTKETLSANVRDQFMKGMVQNVKRLDEVILDLNAILRVKKDVHEKRELVNLPVLIDNITASIKTEIESEQVTLETDFTELSEFYSLKTYLHSIFYNLILNSIKFRQPDIPPHIQIKSSVVKDKIQIHFKDNGSGIDLARRKNDIFGLYKRFHPNAEGKGMGLFMVKTQMNMLGGSIAINSEVNKGTEFLLEFNLNNQ